MRKVMLAVAMLAMVLVVAVPAFAQGNQEQFGASQHGDVTQTQIQCVQTAVNNNAQYNVYGDNVNVQAIAQECNISVAQVENVLAVISGGEGAAPEGEAAAEGEMGVLPDTGGASLFTVGAGALLVAGGLLARKLVR